MDITRRHALRLVAGTVPAALAGGGLGSLAGSLEGQIPSSPGRFLGTRASLGTYTVPDWFADAKFGIWAHWGPQSAVGDGDWYARNMYIQGTGQNRYHVERFGHPSRVGYKDLIHLFTAERWDPEALMDRYVRAGARYFVSMGVHHDNFDLWRSRHQPRWNAVASGPRRDIVGQWAAAARRRGLRFGVSEHLSNSFDWLAPAHLSDTTGPLAGVPYDGADPAWADLYHDYSAMPAGFARGAEAMGRVAPEAWKARYLDRIRDLVDTYQPDLLYTDGGIPFEEYGLSAVAELYNVGPLNRYGRSEAVYTSKSGEDCAQGTCVLDRERSVVDGIRPDPWQTDTCIGDWHYKAGQVYKTPKKVIDLLVDIVSKNGNLLLNLPLPASGELDAGEERVLEGISSWMSINGEGIFATRPWRINGEGPAMSVRVPRSDFNEGSQPDLGPEDIRFTARGRTLYAFVQGWPRRPVTIRALGAAGGQGPEKVSAVWLLGRDEPLDFRQQASGLEVRMPERGPGAGEIGIALRINLA